MVSAHVVTFQLIPLSETFDAKALMRKFRLGSTSNLVSVVNTCGGCSKAADGVNCREPEYPVDV